MRTIRLALCAGTGLSLLSMMVAASLPAQAQAPAQPALKPFQQVEVADSENPGRWNSCRVITPFKAAVEVECNYTRMMVRYTSVRLKGGQPPAESAAEPASEPFKTDDVVLASVMSLVDDWRLCVVLRNQVTSTNSYQLRCAGANYNVQTKWVRADDGGE